MDTFRLEDQELLVHALLVFIDGFDPKPESLIVYDSQELSDLIQFFRRIKSDLEMIRKEDSVMEMLREHGIFGLQALNMAKNLIKMCTEQNLPIKRWGSDENIL